MPSSSSRSGSKSVYGSGSSPGGGSSYYSSGNAQSSGYGGSSTGGYGGIPPQAMANRGCVTPYMMYLQTYYNTMRSFSPYCAPSCAPCAYDCMYTPPPPFPRR